MMHFLKFCAVTIHDPCIQLTARLSIFAHKFMKKAQYHLFVTGQKPIKMHLCEMKKQIFSSIVMLYSQKGVTNTMVRKANKTLGKS